MTLSAALGISLSGMQAESRQLGTVAHNVANGQTAGYDRLKTEFSSISENGGVSATALTSGSAAFSGTSNVDPANEMLDMIGAGHGFAANAAVFETGADMWDMLLTIVRD